MKCPVCGMSNSESSLKCNCGYDLQSRELEGGPTPATTHQVSATGVKVAYDPAEIEDCARRLYAQANAIIRSCTVLGAFAGTMVGGPLGYLMANESAGAAWVGALAGLVLGGLAGHEVGKTRAVSLRLQAQNALCLMQVEINTRNR